MKKKNPVVKDSGDAFEDHLAHYSCEYCITSYSEAHEELIRSGNAMKLQLENLQGVIRSYRQYQEELFRKIRKLEREAEEPKDPLDEEVSRMKVKLELLEKAVKDRGYDE